MTKVLISALIVSTLLLLGTGLFMQHQRGTIERLRTDNSQLQTRAAALDKQIDLATQAYVNMRNERQRIDARYHALRQQINDAPAADDAPIAPVLKQTLEALR